LPRRRRPKVLLLGSEPFGGLARNPAAEIVGHLCRQADGTAQIIGAILPVSHAELPRKIADLVGRHDPDIALGLGLFVGAGYVRIETTAINLADFDVADNHGKFIRNETLDEHGPHARRATYEAPDLAATLCSRGIPSRVSHHAGTHLCNLTLYNLLKANEAGGGRAAIGFIHLPLIPDQVAELIEAEARQDHATVRAQSEYASMALAMEIAAIEIVIAALVEEEVRRANRSDSDREREALKAQPS
jgi:pyroglutamyl-peptidase